MTIRLHLGEQREQILRLGHEHGLVGVLGHRLVLLAVHERRHEVLEVDDAHDAVDVLVIHRQTRVARAAHALHRLAHRVGVFREHHVHARRHDLVHGHVAQIEDVVDHALLVLEQLVVVRDHVLDLFFGHVLALVGVLDAEQARQPVRGRRGQRHQRRSDFLEHHERSGHHLADALGIGQRDALRHQLAHHDAEV